MANDEKVRAKARAKVVGIGFAAMQRGERSTSIFSNGLGFFSYQFDGSGAKLVATMSLEEAFQYYKL